MTAALFEILEIKKLVESGARLVLLAAGAHNRVLADIMAAESGGSAPPPPVAQVS